ncbi:MAG TPA: hypothetical protein PKE04_20465, partial [Clostridia bacterium]|nr:hypothetical protein [Clostridia bacterium]
MNKRLLSLLIAALMLLSGTALAYNGADDLVISAEPFTATLFYAFGGNGAPKGDMPIWQKTAEITGVSMENVANESITDALQSLNTMLASGELPDIIQGLRANLEPLISQGAFMPLDDLLQYAPNLQRFFEEFPDAARARTARSTSLPARWAANPARPSRPWASSSARIGWISWALPCPPRWKNTRTFCTPSATTIPTATAKRTRSRCSTATWAFGTSCSCGTRATA